LSPSHPASNERIAAEHQALALQRYTASFCSRFPFFFAHVAPDEPRALAQQLAAERPHVLEFVTARRAPS
jgi:hypothetical protein